ncbi:MAG: hypothetical protein NTNFB01_25210 [Nitrospira sp.]
MDSIAPAGSAKQNGSRNHLANSDEPVPIEPYRDVFAQRSDPGQKASLNENGLAREIPAETSQFTQGKRHKARLLIHSALIIN